MQISNKKIALIRAAGGGGLLLIGKSVVDNIFVRGRADPNAYATVDGTAVAFIIYTLICVIFCFSYFQKRNNYSILAELCRTTPLKWFVIYSAIALISSIWSVNSVLSGYRAVECFAIAGVMLAALIEAMRTGGRRFTIEWVCFYVSLVSVMSLLRRFSYVGFNSWILQSSQMLATVFFYFALLASRKKIYKIIIGALSIFSCSTTSYIGMALGSTCLFRSKNKIPAFILCVTVAVGMFFWGPEKFIKETVFSQREEMSWENSSGRDRMLEQVWEGFCEAPVLGYGFFAGEVYVMRMHDIGAMVTNAHSSFGSAALGTGILGLIPMTAFIVGAFLLINSRRIPKEYSAAFAGSFWVALAHCCGNPSVGSKVYGAWIGVMLLIMTAAVFSMPEDRFYVLTNGDER